MILQTSMFEIGAQLAFVPVLSQSFSQIYAQLQNCLLTRAGVTVYFNAQVRIPRRLCTIMGEQRQSTLRKKILVAFSLQSRYTCDPMAIFIVTAVNVIHVLTFYIFHRSCAALFKNCNRRKQTAGCDIFFPTILGTRRY